MLSLDTVEEELLVKLDAKGLLVFAELFSELALIFAELLSELSVGRDSPSDVELIDFNLVDVEALEEEDLLISVFESGSEPYLPPVRAVDGLSVAAEGELVGFSRFEGGLFPASFAAIASGDVNSGDLSFPSSICSGVE